MAQTQETEILLTIDLDKAKKDLAALTKQIQDLNASSESSEEDVKALEKQWDQLSETIKKAEKAQQPLGQRLKDIQKQLQLLKANGLDNTETYRNLMVEAGNLRDAMGDVSQAINKTASDTANLDAALEAMSLASGGFGLVTSAMSMLGVESENAEKAQKKLLQAIALMNSVQQISNTLKGNSVLITKLQTLSEKLFNAQLKATATASMEAAAGMKVFKTAIISTGIGALIVGLTFAVQKLNDYIEKTKVATKHANEWKKAMQDQQDVANNAYKEHQKGAEAMAKSQEKVKKSIDDARKAVERFGETSSQTLARMKKDVDKNKFATDVQKKAYEDAVKAATDASRKYQEFAEEYERRTEKGIIQGESQKKLLEDLKEKRDEAMAAANEAESAYVEAATTEQKNLLDILELEKKITEERKARKREYDEQTRQNKEQESQLLLDFAADDPVKKYEQMQKNIDLQRENALASEKQRYEKELENKELTDKEKERLQTIHEQKIYNIHLEWLGKIQAADDEYNAYLNDIQSQYDQDLINARTVLAQNSINAMMQIKLESLTREYNAEIENARKIGADTTAITAAYETQKTKIQLEASAERVGIAQTMTADITSALGSLFEENKGVQIASTVASTIADAAATFTKTMAQGGAYATPLAAAASAAVAARGIAAISKLKNTSKNAKSVPGIESASSINTQNVVNTGTSAVSRAIVSRNIPSTVTTEKTQTVLVVDDVTAKQMEQDKINKVSTI